VRTSVGTRMILGAGLASALTIGVMALLVTGGYERHLIADRTDEADLFSETIKSSTLYNMMENHREGLHRQIETIGRQDGIEQVRVFNKEGVIMFSSDAEEIGLALDKQAESCYACHVAGQPLERLPIDARARVFRKADGDRVLGIIQPIQNQPRCSEASCHAHSPDQSLLGVLDVTVSLAEMDAQIAEGRVRMTGLATLAILASSLSLAWMTRRLVVRPVRALAAGTRALADGDLTTRIPETGSHELGELARAFNSMTQKLAEARHQVVQAEKLASVGRLAAGVAHEINNPLTGVLTYASLLRRQVDDRPEFAEDLDVIVRETKRCREIVKGLLDFSRQTAPVRRSIDVNEVVRRAIAVVMHRLKLGRVSLDLDLSPDPEIVSADANQIQQVVVNLLLNAVDALGSGRGTIRLETRSSIAPGGNSGVPHAGGPLGTEIVVQDSGHGIPAETLAHVLDPFFSTKGVRGTGLGLAVSWGIVMSHGGSITVKSDVGEGTRFSVWLPRETCEEARSSVA